MLTRYARNMNIGRYAHASGGGFRFVSHENATERPAGVNKKHDGSTGAISQFQMSQIPKSKFD